ncbi:uracil phosphoribosyltransferase-domain-containing protein [Xylariales sp. PMI_506]|nr:uracil phosphoribosyltransferase-domain-containing protein [Xylariales sp. PMI_506]
MTHSNGNQITPSSERVTILEQGNYLLSCMTTIRNSETSSGAFANAFQKVADQLIIAALNLIPTERITVPTPTGLNYDGVCQTAPICGVSILRAGASFESSLRRAYGENMCMGMILIQRNEETCLPVHLYSKLPEDIASKTVLILEPMLATGGSASKAIEVLKERGVPESNIIFVNLVASRKGLDIIMKRFPLLRLVTAAVDNDLTASNHIAPGLGDFGDRFYGTV